MRSTFLLILGLCAGSFQQLLLPYPPGVCYEKDEVPVDVDGLYDGDCVDLYGNKYSLDSELYSCCDCFRYKCEEIDYWGKQKKVGWVRSVSEQCCQNCNGTVYPSNTVISTTMLEDDCLTTQTEVCRVRPGLKTAVIEQEFSYRNCCNDNNKTLQYLGAEVPEPRTCSIRICEYEESWPHSVWITEKELEGCDCCLLPNGTLVADGATWWDNSVTPPEMKECCRGQIVTTESIVLPVCYGIFIAGGKGGGTEVYIPPAPSCPKDIQHCLLSNYPVNTGQTQDGFLMCGGVEQPLSCSNFNPESGQWESDTNTWKDPPRIDHVSWNTTSGLFLMGGRDSPFTTTMLPSGDLGFGIQETEASCSIQFEDFVIVTGGGGKGGKQAFKYFANGTIHELPFLLTPRSYHACGSYIQDGKEMLIVVGGIIEIKPHEITDTVEIYDLSKPAKEWTPAANFPEPIFSPSGVTLDNIFNVIGDDFIWSWDPEFEIWTKLTPLCYPNFGERASVVPVTEGLLQNCQRICYDKE